MTFSQKQAIIELLHASVLRDFKLQTVVPYTPRATQINARLIPCPEMMAPLSLIYLSLIFIFYLELINSGYADSCMADMTKSTVASVGLINTLRHQCPHMVHFNVPRDWFETNWRHQRYSEGGKKFRGCRGQLGRSKSSIDGIRI